MTRLRLGLLKEVGLQILQSSENANGNQLMQIALNTSPDKQITA